MTKLCAIDYESAFSFRMPFGRYKGLRMGDLPKKYLEWASNNLKGSIKARANILLICGEQRG
jgi:uncharacterized protein (DUF3820 family)